MQSFLDENNFKKYDDCFANDNFKICVEYSDEKQTYSLLVAQKDEDGNFCELTAVNSWLFDDSQNEKDAVSVGIDFVNSLRKALGIKHIRGISSTGVELPTANKSGSMTVTGFTKKMLDVFPVLKDEYKAHITVYGNFLYVNFFGENLVPQLKNLFAVGTKKQIKKLYDVFEDAYLKGDKDTVNIMLALLCAASYNDEKCHSAIVEMLNNNNHFLQGYQNFKQIFPKSKKLVTALIK